jgi:predicted dehydrogenase
MKMEPLKVELESFLECMRKGREPEVTGVDGLRSLEIALALSESATKNTVIVL